MIELKNICKEYVSRKKKMRALHNVNLTLGENGLVCLVGESGCGKTTLLNLLGTLDSPSYGDILIDGKSLVNMREKERHVYRATQIGFIFQDLNLIESLTVRDNLLLVCDKDELESKHRATLQKLKIDEFADKLPKELSGGQRQRVAIARAIVKGSRILLCDEPTGSLDPDNAVIIFETLKEISCERLVVVVSHDIATASKYADRMIRLHNGEVQSDTASEQEYSKEQENAPYAQTAEVSSRPKAKQRLRGLFGLSVRYLKCKPARLTIMAVISVLIFTLLSVVSAVSSYDQRTLVGQTMAKKNVNYFLLQREFDGHLVYTAPQSIAKKNNSAVVNWTDASIEKAAATLHSTVDPVYSIYQMASFANVSATQCVTGDFFCPDVKGVIRMTPDLAERYGFTLYGQTPIAVNEVVIGGYTYEMYKISGYQGETTDTVEKISSPYDMIGKQIVVRDGYSEASKKSVLTVTGVLDTHFNVERYDCMKLYEGDVMKTLRREFDAIREGCAHNFLYISDAFYNRVVVPIKEENSGKSDVRVYNPASGLTKAFAVMEDINNLAGGKVFYAPDINANSDAVFCNSYDLFGGDDFANIAEQAIQDAVNMIAADKSKLCVYSLTGDFASSVPFGGMYYNPSNMDENAMYVQNNIRDKIFAEFTAYENDQVDGVRTIISDIMIPANGRKANKRLLRYHEKSMALSTKEPIIFSGHTPNKYQADNMHYVFSNEAHNAINHADHVFAPIARYAWYVFLSVALLTVLIIYLYFGALINSREKDAGVLRTNGYTKVEIALLFVLEALILSGIFIALSTVISAVSVSVAAAVFRNKYNLLFTPLRFTFAQVGLIIGFQLLFAAVGILLPLLLLLRKKPMQIINAGK